MRVIHEGVLAEVLAEVSLSVRQVLRPSTKCVGGLFGCTVKVADTSKLPVVLFLEVRVTVPQPCRPAPSLVTVLTSFFFFFFPLLFSYLIVKLSARL